MAVGLTLAACNGSSETITVDVKDAARSDSTYGPLLGSVDVLTQHNDVTRSGQNVNETVLNTSNVSSSTFGKLFTLPTDGLVWAQPLIVSNYEIAGKTRNLVIVASGHNSVYAFDADVGGEPLWQINLGPSVPASVITGPGLPANIPIEVGVLSTPVIDRTRGIVYVTDKTYVNETQQQWLHALDLTTGKDEPGSPVLIDVTIPLPAGAPAAGGATTIALDPPHHAQRPALLLVNGVVYLGFGAHDDRSPYHGWIVGYEYGTTKSFEKKSVFCSTPDGNQGGIWQSAQGLVSDGASLYAVTGNGTLSAENGGASYGQSFLKLSFDLKVQDWFAPADNAALSRVDLDMGAGGPVLLPTASAPLIATGSKAGVLYVVDTANMGKVGKSSDTNLEEFQAVQRFCGSPVVWSTAAATRLYIWGSGGPAKEFALANRLLGTTPAASSASSIVNIVAVGYANPVGNLAISSDQANDGTGILWATNPVSNPETVPVAGTLHAFDALTLDELWNSKQVEARDDFGMYAKFVPPTIANGKVYLATFSNAVYVYGLLPAQ